MGKLFGTNGVRGIANVEITPQLAQQLGVAMGSYWRSGRVLVGGDARTSTPMLKAAAISGLQAAGCAVDDAGVAPTPALQLACGRGGYEGGVIVTASHNPPEFNGIKGLDKGGIELSREQEDAIEEIHFSGRAKLAGWRGLKPVGTVVGAPERYVQAVLARVDRARIAARGFSVVLDCANGVGALATPHLLRELGCRIVTLNGQLDGFFPGHPSEPTPENLRDLSKMVVECHADLGVAQDGDADRAVFVDASGNFIPGERVLAFLAGKAVEAKGGGVVVTPVSSSSCVEDVVKAAGGRVVYTAVGSPVVARAMLKEKAVLGGEENGGIIFPEHQLVRDSALAIARMLELLTASKGTLADLLESVPRYATVKKKIACPNEKKERALKAFAASQRGAKVDATDGVKVLLKDGWVLVRPSGTEPLFRVYAEAKEQARAERLAEEKLRELKELLGEG